MSDTPSYYAIIPADVRYDDRLKPAEKLMYGEVTCLSAKTGVCFASNGYFARLYDVAPETVSRWVRNLCKCGYLGIYIDPKTSNRQLTLLTKRSRGYDEKINPPLDEKIKHNTTSNNNIINKGTTSKRKGMRVENSDLMNRVGAFLKRRPSTAWSQDEKQRLTDASPTEEELLLIEKYYLSKKDKIISCFGADIRRRSLSTLLNNWSGEFDRAFTFNDWESSLKAEQKETPDWLEQSLM